MNTFKTVLAAFLLVSVSSFASIGTTRANPSAVKITIYGVAVSPNADCSDAKGFNYTGGKEINFVAGETIFSQTIADASYKCVILLMSDRIKVTPATTFSEAGGTCTAGVETQQVVCRANSSQYYTAVTINADGTVTFGAKTECTATTASGSDIVPLFLSTTSTHTGNEVPYAFLQPVAGNASSCGGAATGCGINIANAFTVAGTTTGTFVVDFTGAVDIQDGVCSVEAPIFNFK